MLSGALWRKNPHLPSLSRLQYLGGAFLHPSDHEQVELQKAWVLSGQVVCCTHLCLEGPLSLEVSAVGMGLTSSGRWLIAPNNSAPGSMAYWGLGWLSRSISWDPAQRILASITGSVSTATSCIEKSPTHLFHETHITLFCYLKTFKDLCTWLFNDPISVSLSGFISHHFPSCPLFSFKSSTLLFPKHTGSWLRLSYLPGMSAHLLCTSNFHSESTSPVELSLTSPGRVRWFFLPNQVAPCTSYHNNVHLPSHPLHALLEARSSFYLLSTCSKISEFSPEGSSTCPVRNYSWAQLYRLYCPCEWNFYLLDFLVDNC